MKKVVLLIFLGLVTCSLSAQEADTHIASLVNNEEWFALAEDLPQYSDSMQADYLRLIAEAMLQSRTNRTEEVYLYPSSIPQQIRYQTRKRDVIDT